MRRPLSFIPVVFIALGCGKDAPTYSGPPVAAINVDSPASSIIIGQMVQLTASMIDINGDAVTGAPLTWQSSSTTIASVDQIGRVTGRGEGAVRIRAISGNARDSVDLIVNTNTYDVFTPGEVFLPNILEIPVGATVRFNMFGGEGHDATFANVPGRPADIPVVLNQIVSRTFTVRGTFPYDCFVHPGMSGQIVVE